MKLHEAIPGHRVIVNQSCVTPDLRGEHAIVLLNEREDFNADKVYIELVSKNAWPIRKIYLYASSLDHAPSYDDLVRELAKQRELAGKVPDLEATNIAREKVINDLREINRRQAKGINDLHERESVLEGQLQAARATASHRLDMLNNQSARESTLRETIATLESELRRTPRTQEFTYLVNSETNPDMLYTITVRHGAVVHCTCLGFHFHGYCKHAQHFVIPVEAQEAAPESTLTANSNAQYNTLRLIAELTEKYR